MKIQILIVAVIAVSFTFLQTSCKSKADKVLKPHVTIADLKEKQSAFADSLITLLDVHIESCESILNYSKAVIGDGSGGKILLLTDKPYKCGERTDISGRLLVVYQKDNESCLVFIDNHLKPMKDLLQLVKGSVGL